MTAVHARFPFQDPANRVENRVEDLLSRMDEADKAGLLFHAMAAAGDPTAPHPFTGGPSTAELIRARRMTHFNVIGSFETGRDFAEWHNALQDIAAEHPLQIPVTLSTDPRHAFTDNPLTSILAGPFSQWPESLGLAALVSPEWTERFADVVRQEYLAVGLRVALHPQLDLATEPRWARIGMTFGEDAGLTARLGQAYLRGLKGGSFGRTSVSAIVKHFPGGGPQRDGTDPHFATGKEQIYPGGRFEYHLEPFIAAIAGGARQMMPYYGVPIGTPYEEVAFGFNRGIVTDLLRHDLGFDGIVCSDWGLLTDEIVLGAPMAARAWGVEDLSVSDRMLKALDAGVDQFGGETCTDVLLDLLAGGRVAPERIDDSVRRLLREKFELGLFDRPRVDPDAADTIVGSSAFVADGERAQRESLTLLINRPGRDGALLPLDPGVKIYCDGMAAAALQTHGSVVDRPVDADVAVIRLRAPFEVLGPGLQSLFHEGSLEFDPETIDRVRTLAEVVPTIVVVYADRPPILTEIAAVATGLIIDFGCSDRDLADVLFGATGPRGRLPFDLPRSMAAVRASRSDTPFDTADPLFTFGFGLRYEGAADGSPDEHGAS